MEAPPQLQFSDTIVKATILRWIPYRVRPNHITLLRLAATPVVLWLIVSGRFLWGTILFFLAALTDLIDGAMARTRGQITTLGKIIDPIADKLLVGSLAIVMVATYLSAELAAIIIAFEVLFLMGGALRYRQGYTLQANWWGKIKMNFQVLGAFLLLLAVAFAQPALIPWAERSFFLSIFFALLSLVTHGF